MSAPTEPAGEGAAYDVDGAAGGPPEFAIADAAAMATAAAPAATKASGRRRGRWTGSASVVMTVLSDVGTWGRARWWGGGRRGCPPRGGAAHPRRSGLGQLT